MNTDPADRWQQRNLHLTHRPGAQQALIDTLAAAMPALEADAVIDGWWFIRKHGWWRLRYRTTAHTTPREDVIAAIATRLQEAGWIEACVPVIYEPETHAFGGPYGMTIAHQLFHRDSRAIVQYRHDISAHHGPDHRRERSLLLCSALMRAAGQDWYEQGDIWARIAEHRQPNPAIQQPRPNTEQAQAVARFLRAEAIAPETTVADCWPGWAEWLGALTATGTALGLAASSANLTRGLRACLAHHILFHWNRLGLPANIQYGLAIAARATILTD